MSAVSISFFVRNPPQAVGYPVLRNALPVKGTARDGQPVRPGPDGEMGHPVVRNAPQIDAAAPPIRLFWLFWTSNVISWPAIG